MQSCEQFYKKKNENYVNLYVIKVILNYYPPKFVLHHVNQYFGIPKATGSFYSVRPKTGKLGKRYCNFHATKNYYSPPKFVLHHVNQYFGIPKSYWFFLQCTTKTGPIFVKLSSCSSSPEDLTTPLHLAAYYGHRNSFNTFVIRT